MSYNVPMSAMSAKEQTFVKAVFARNMVKVSMPSNVSEVVVDERGNAPQYYSGVIAMVRHNYTNYEEVMAKFSAFMCPESRKATMSMEAKARAHFASEEARAFMQQTYRVAIEEQARKMGMKLYVRK